MHEIVRAMIPLMQSVIIDHERVIVSKGLKFVYYSIQPHIL